MALFQPTNITPSDLSGVGTIDALNDLPVTWQVNGTGNTPMTAYQIDIMMNDTDSTLLYSTGQVALSDPFYGADSMGNPQYFTATINAAALAAAGVINSKDNVYKLLITQWWSAGEYVQQSSASVFIARETPSVSISNFSATITTVSYEFLGSYSQAQGDPIEWARWQISGSANNDILVDTGRIYGVGELKTSYDGFLNGYNYIIRLSGETVNGAEFDTGWKTFVASYDLSVLDGAMTTCTRHDTDAVQISFPTPLYTMGAGGGDYEIKQYLYKEAGPSAVVSVNDAVAGPLKSMTVSMTPTQNLNGYANPWPAGGGANKFDAITWVTLGSNTAYYTASSDETITVDHEDVSGISNRLLDVEAGETYSYRTTFASVRIFNSSSTTIASTTTGTFTAPADGKIAVKFYGKSYPASGNFILAKSNTVPSAWSPYSNICPISGHTGAKGMVSAINLLDDTGARLKQKNISYARDAGYGTAVTLKAGVTYTVSCNSATPCTAVYIVHAYDSPAYAQQYGSTSCTYTPTEDIEVGFDFYWGGDRPDDATHIMLEIGPTASDYVPYTGSTAPVTFGILGKNYLNMAVASHNAWSFVNIPNTLKPDTEYTYSINGSTSYYYALYLADSNSTTRQLVGNKTAGESGTFTTPADMSSEPYLCVAGSVSGAGNESISNIKPQVELGSSKTAYEPYNDVLYEGTFEFVTGLLTANYAKIILNGMQDIRHTNWRPTATSVGWIYYYDLTNNKPVELNNQTPNILCESLITCDYQRIYNGAYDYAISALNYAQGTTPSLGLVVRIGDTSLTTASAINTYLASNPITAVYELAEPITYQLTPNQINALLGENNMWSDAGDVTVEYPIDNTSYLKLPSNADSVTWDSAGSAPFSIAAPFGFAWRAIIKDVTASLPLISMSMANGILNATVSATGVSVTISGQTLFNATATIADEDDVMILIEQNTWALYVNGTVEDSGSLSDWQDEITSIMLYGPQDCLFLWIVDGTFTAQQIGKAEGDTPEYDSTTHFLAKFSDGLSAGAIRAQEDVSRVTLYRRQSGKVSVQKLMSSAPNITAVRDYAALNGNTYTYTLVGETEDGNSTSAISSNSISPCIWNYTLMLCSQDANGFYHVQQEYRFSLDISSGTENNNNNPALQANFTRYPLRQPNAQNYRSGTLTSFVGKAVNGKYVDSLSEIDALREISTSSLYKFLKNRKGEIMLVDTASPITTTITDKYEKQPVRAAIPWAEIGKAEGKSVITVSGDTYWPNIR